MTLRTIQIVDSLLNLLSDPKYDCLLFKKTLVSLKIGYENRRLAIKELNTTFKDVYSEFVKVSGFRYPSLELRKRIGHVDNAFYTYLSTWHNSVSDLRYYRGFTLDPVLDWLHPSTDALELVLKLRSEPVSHVAGRIDPSILCEVLSLRLGGVTMELSK